MRPTEGTEDLQGKYVAQSLYVYAYDDTRQQKYVAQSLYAYDDTRQHMAHPHEGLPSMAEMAEKNLNSRLATRPLLPALPPRSPDCPPPPPPRRSGVCTDSYHRKQ